MNTEVFDGLRNRLWNAISEHYFPLGILCEPIGKTGKIFFFVRDLYDGFFKEVADDVVLRTKVEFFRDEIRKKYMKLDWKGLVPFLEFIVNYGKIDYIIDNHNVAEVNVKRFIDKCNIIFEEEKMNCRFVDQKIVCQ